MDELKELKSKAYDLIDVMESAQIELKEINKKIRQIMLSPKTEEKIDLPKEA